MNSPRRKTRSRTSSPVSAEQRCGIKAAVRRGLSPLKEDEPLSLSQWADRYFYLSPESSSVEGRWRTLPYQRAIMNVISNDDVEVMSWQKCGRVGYTKIIVAATGYFTEHKKRSQVLFQPTDGDAQDFVKDEIDPMLRDVSVVGRLLKSDPDKKSKHNTTEKKSFIGSTLDIRGGKSSKNYRRLTKDVVYYDELDGFDPDIDSQGDATSLGDKRLTTSSFPKSIRGSTPTETGVSQVEHSISHADMRFHRYVPCPECGELQQLLWSKLKFDNHDPTTARHECEVCGYGATFDQYPEMDAAGVWKTEDGHWIDEQDSGDVLRDRDGSEVDWPKHVGFWIWGAYSYDLSWPKLVDEFIEAKREEKRGNITKLKTFVNMRLAETWEEEGETKDPNALYRRREHYAAQVPEGVQILTAFVDVQDDRFEYEVSGWGFGEESWSVDYQRLYGDLSQSQIWDLLANKLRQQYRHESGVLMDIRLIGIDSGGHFTDEVYQFSRKHGVRRVIPTKGHTQRNQPIAAFPRKPNKKGVYLTMIGADTAKELIYQRYDIHEPGAGYCHHPVRDEYDEIYFEQATTERKIKRYSYGRPYFVFDAGKRRNEVLDCKVGNLAMIRIAQQHKGFQFQAAAVPDAVAAAPASKQQGDTYTKNGIKRRRSKYL